MDTPPTPATEPVITAEVAKAAIVAVLVVLASFGLKLNVSVATIGSLAGAISALSAVAAVFVRRKVTPTVKLDAAPPA